MKTTIAILFFLATPVPLFATAQIMENIIIDGNRHRMASLPLDSYFISNRTERSISEIRDSFQPMSSACWRRYIGTWEIKENHLWLLSLRGAKGDIPLSELFHGKEPPIKAGWFTGKLRIVKGKVLVYKHTGFDSIYERDLFIDIKDGKVVSQRISFNEKPIALQQPPSSLSRADIINVVRSKQAELSNCVQQARNLEPRDDSITVVMVWTVEPDGKPTEIQPKLDVNRDTLLVECLTPVIASMRFPPYSGPRMGQIEFPFSF